MRTYLSVDRTCLARSETRRRTAQWRFVIAAAACGLLTACSPQVVMQPAPLDAPTQQETRVLRLTVEVAGVSTAGYSRTLRTGTQWQPVGDIDQGQVLKPLDTVLTVEGANVREAYAVVRNGSWIGFWLPVERAFSPLRKPVAITFEEVRQ